MATYHRYSTIVEWVQSRKSFARYEFLERFPYENARSASNVLQRLKDDKYIVLNGISGLWEVTEYKPVASILSETKDTPENHERQELIKEKLIRFSNLEDMDAYLEADIKSPAGKLVQTLVYIKNKEPQTDIATLLYNTERVISHLEKDNPKWIPTVDSLTITSEEQTP